MISLLSQRAYDQIGQQSTITSWRTAASCVSLALVGLGSDLYRLFDGGHSISSSCILKTIIAVGDVEQAGRQSRSRKGKQWSFRPSQDRCGKLSSRLIHGRSSRWANVLTSSSRWSTMAAARSYWSSRETAAKMRRESRRKSRRKPRRAGTAYPLFHRRPRLPARQGAEGR